MEPSVYCAEFIKEQFMKNYKFIEKGTDFWGRKRFEVEEDKSSNEGSIFGFLLIALFLLVVIIISHYYQGILFIIIKY